MFSKGKTSLVTTIWLGSVVHLDHFDSTIYFRSNLIDFELFLVILLEFIQKKISQSLKFLCISENVQVYSEPSWTPEKTTKLKIQRSIYEIGISNFGEVRIEFVWKKQIASVTCFDFNRIFQQNCWQRRMFDWIWGDWNRCSTIDSLSVLLFICSRTEELIAHRHHQHIGNRILH